MASDLTFVDLFSGAGGLSLGLESAGLAGRMAVDFDADSVDTYTKNFDHPAVEIDVTRVSRSWLTAEIGDLSEIDVVAGGPPCQGFSVQRRGPDLDDRNRMVGEFGRVVLDVRPRAFIMENVIGLLSKRGLPLVNDLVHTFEASGYATHIKKLTAYDFGVPQLRKRVFIVGVLDELDGSNFKFPEPTTPMGAGTVRDAISDLMGSSEVDVPNHRSDRLSPLNVERIRSLGPGETRERLPEHLQLACHKIQNGHRHLDTYSRMAWDEPAPTITARFDSFSRGRFGHPELDRTITLREGARLQGFPDRFAFVGTKVSVARQIGNAVPPPLAMAVGRSVAEHLDRALAR